jgi:DNA-binding CsgD family transcriptional regulator
VAEVKLTAREQEVLRLVGEGRTNHEIAAALRISVWTAANHRKHICAKLGVHSTAGLVAIARSVHSEATDGHNTGRDRERTVECVLKIDLPHPEGRLKLTYRGRLRQTPGIAEVRIGRMVFHF